jgi:hypothetical protein
MDLGVLPWPEMAGLVNCVKCSQQKVAVLYYTGQV